MKHRVLPLRITRRAHRVSPGCGSPDTESGCGAGSRGKAPAEEQGTKWLGTNAKCGRASLGGCQGCKVVRGS